MIFDLANDQQKHIQLAARWLSSACGTNFWFQNLIDSYVQDAVSLDRKKRWRARRSIRFLVNNSSWKFEIARFWPYQRVG
jgi:hypothetical protein